MVFCQFQRDIRENTLLPKMFFRQESGLRPFGSTSFRRPRITRLCLCHWLKNHPLKSRHKFLSQSLPFPAVTFCNFNAIKNNPLQAAKDTDKELFNEVFAIELGKCSQVILHYLSIFARTVSYSDPWENVELINQYLPGIQWTTNAIGLDVMMH